MNTNREWKQEQFSKASKNAVIHIVFIPYNTTCKKHKGKTEKTISLSNIIQCSVVNNIMFPHRRNKDHMWKTISRNRNGNYNLFLTNGTDRFLTLLISKCVLVFANVPFPKIYV